MQNRNEKNSTCIRKKNTYRHNLSEEPLHRNHYDSTQVLLIRSRQPYQQLIVRKCGTSGKSHFEPNDTRLETFCLCKHFPSVNVLTLKTKMNCLSSYKSKIILQQDSRISKETRFFVYSVLAMRTS